MQYYLVLLVQRLNEGMDVLQLAPSRVINVDCGPLYADVKKEMMVAAAFTMPPPVPIRLNPQICNGVENQAFIANLHAVVGQKYATGFVEMEALCQFIDGAGVLQCPVIAYHWVQEAYLNLLRTAEVYLHPTKQCVVVINSTRSYKMHGVLTRLTWSTTHDMNVQGQLLVKLRQCLELNPQ